MSSDDMNHVQEDLERYGVWVKAGPDELTDQEGIGFELTDLDELNENDMLITEEEEKMLGKLEESALPDFTETEDTSAAEMDGESKQLLHKIEGEINALRGDVLQLKNELTILRTPEVMLPADTPAAPGGFFEDEDEETIALTEDELDNIFDSAEMTEESAAPEPPPDSADTSEISLIDDTSHEAVTAEDDPAISILGSPQDSEALGDHSETIEINIPGIDDDAEGSAGESALGDDDEASDGFEEAVNQEIINMSGAEADDEADQPIPSIGDIEMEMGEEESVEIDLSALEDDAPDTMDVSKSGDIEIDELTLDDFALEQSGDDLESITLDIIESDEPAVEEAAPGGDTGDIQTGEIDLKTDDTAREAAPEDDIPDIRIDDIPEITLDMDALESVDQFTLDELKIPAESDETVDAVPPDGTGMEDITPGEPEGGSFDSSAISTLPVNLREEMREALTYMDDLLGALPDEKITEFMQTRHYEVYKKLFKELGDS